MDVDIFWRQFVPTHGMKASVLQLCVCGCRALRIWELGQKGMVMQTKEDRASNGLCCKFHPLGGVVATG